MFFICDLIGFGPIPWLMMSELFSPEVSKLEHNFKALTTNKMFSAGQVCGLLRGHHH